MDAIELFKESLEWLKNNYDSKPFFLERDIVWTVQTYLIDQIRTRNLGSEYRVVTEWPIENRYADLAILQNGQIRLIAEFKYEPSHDRKLDFSEGKFKQPIVFWSGKQSVEEDISRIKEFSLNKAQSNLVGISIFIDEGGWFYKRHTNLPGWEKWGKETVALISWSNQ